MTAPVDMVIVSAFGRGHWMAWELADQGLRVQLVDVSESLGRWTPEDWEGPFGFSKKDHFSASQIARLQEEDDLDPVHDGWTFWVPDGPMDTHGPLASHFLNGPLKNDRITDKFEESWPTLIRKSLSSNIYYNNWDALNSSALLDVVAPFYIHRVSRRGFQNSLEWCRKKGVEVFNSAHLVDVQVENSQVNGVEVQSHYKGVLRSPQFIWSLTSLETQKLRERISVELFPNGPLPSEWSWIRYRIGCDIGIYEKVIPLHSVLIDDLHVPWSHSNLIILQKTVKREHFDAWVRLPTHHRFQRAYLEDVGQELIEVIQRKFPGPAVQVLEMPQDYLYEYEELGPSLFPVFNRERWLQFTTRRLSNLAFDGPEQWQSLDWAGRYQHQSAIVMRLLEWKKREMEAEAKRRGARDQSVHTS